MSSSSFDVLALIEARQKEAFKYESLNGDDFRVLQLLGSRNAEIECELIHASLNSETCPRYEALSYTWGKLEFVETIKVNDKTLRVTDSLHAALRYLRLPDRDRILWIDAICIDQANNKERSRQVEKMGDVFRCAERVVVWLGKATPEVDLLMHCIHSVDKRDRNYKTIMTNAKEQLRNGLRTLLKRPWFRRVWVIQEIANARSAVICVSDQCVHAHLFAYLPAALELKVDSHCNSLLDLMLHASSPESERHPKQDLGTLLFNYRGCEATDERDKVYALLSMPSLVDDKPLIRPDYTLQTAAVLQETAYSLCEARAYSIGLILDFLGTFRSVTTVCFVFPSDSNFPHQFKNQYSESETIDLLATTLAQNYTHQSQSSQWITHWCVEQQSSSPRDRETCYKELTRLMAKQTFANTFKGIVMAWNKVKQNVLVVLMRGRVKNLLMQASTEGCRTLVENLLNQGADHAVDQYVDDLYGSTLQAASLTGQIQVVQMLLDRGMNVNASGGLFGNALQAASARNQEKMVELLLQHGANVNARGGRDGTALVAASDAANETVVEILLKHGADTNAASVCNSYGNQGPALRAAVMRGNERIVQMLLEHGADVNISGPYGTALDIASRGGDEKMLQLLRANGARTPDLARCT